MPTREHLIRMAVTAALVTVVSGSMLVVPTSAQAAELSTTTQFVGAAATTTTFNAGWIIPISVTDNRTEERVAESAGTVDVFVAGLAGPYVSGLPIFADGVAYFAQPTSRDPLPAGEYSVTAIYQPAAGSGYASSQTAAPVTLSVTPQGVAAQAVLDRAEAATDFRLSLSGDYIDAAGVAPTGTWRLSLADTANDAVVFTSDVAQTSDVTPLDVPVTIELKAGHDYVGTAEFVPDAALAGGLSLTQPTPLSLSVPEMALSEGLAALVPLPLWSIVAGGIVLIALVGAFIALLVGAIRRRRTIEPDPV